MNFAGTGGNNKANIGNVILDKTRHIITAAGTGNALTFTNTQDAKIGTLASDNLNTGTNIGTGWDSLTISGSNADVLMGWKSVRLWNWRNGRCQPIKCSHFNV